MYAFLCACVNGWMDVLQECISVCLQACMPLEMQQKGCQVSILTKKEHWAFCSAPGNTEVIGELLEIGADPDARTDEGEVCIKADLLLTYFFRSPNQSAISISAGRNVDRILRGPVDAPLREPEGTCPRGWAQPASIFLQKAAPRRHERKCWKDTPNSAGSPAESSFRVWGEVHLEVKQTTATWVFYHQVLGSSQAPAGWIFPPKGPWDQTPAGEGSVTFPGPISSGGQWGRARPANLSPEFASAFRAQKDECPEVVASSSFCVAAPFPPPYAG